MLDSKRKPMIVMALSAGLAVLVTGCAYGPPGTAAQMQAGINAVIDATPTNKQIAERNRKQARQRTEWRRKAEERKRQGTLAEARRRQALAAQRFQSRTTGGEGGEGGGGGD
jgi:hypothetical protein